MPQIYDLSPVDSDATEEKVSFTYISSSFHGSVEELDDCFNPYAFLERFAENQLHHRPLEVHVTVYKEFFQAFEPSHK